MNMNGTAIYEAVAVIFASQVFGIQLTLTQQIMVMVTAVLASVGTAGIPWFRSGDADYCLECSTSAIGNNWPVSWY